MPVHNQPIQTNHSSVIGKSQMDGDMPAPHQLGKALGHTVDHIKFNGAEKASQVHALPTAIFSPFLFSALGPEKDYSAFCALGEVPAEQIEQLCQWMKEGHTFKEMEPPKEDDIPGTETKKMVRNHLELMAAAMKSTGKPLTFIKP